MADDPCPNCGSHDFSGVKCSRCGRPRVPEAEYHDRIEAPAWQYHSVGDGCLDHPDGEAG